MTRRNLIGQINALLEKADLRKLRMILHFVREIVK